MKDQPIEVTEAQRAAGKARMASMTAEQRTAFAKQGFAARCAKYRQPPVERPRQRQPVAAHMVQ